MSDQTIYFLLHIRNRNNPKPFKVTLPLANGAFLTEEYVINEAKVLNVLTSEEANHFDTVELVDEKTYKKYGGA
jgi:hypothetical protein